MTLIAHKRGLWWFDVAFNYGGRSNAIQQAEPYWNNHRAFKLRIKKYAYDNAGTLWVSNNRKFIRLKPRVISWSRCRKYDHSNMKFSIKWPQYVLHESGVTFGYVDYDSIQSYSETGYLWVDWWDVERGGGYGVMRRAGKWDAKQVFAHKLHDSETRRFMK